ncbi:hypothetical protein [Sulfobacillus harzensis]|uniref:PD-(D/E)XK endonuclease-like domain-containing protein n=1 Tax=Sulfobacillus harzensis TaxID=2729629 RepID=A0A7Y0L3Y3_9FIRM|nr:hypothetical protein [Sulfobacillus harzensis]NMP22633.1 hypothetical protein [Sulfobacillus harzensis]
MAEPLLQTTLSTASLQQLKYEEELAGPSKFDPHEIRLSEAGQCPRRQTLRALGYVSTPPTLREMAIFETGHLAEERITALWAKQFPGPDQLVREVEVRTEFGVGHIDLWVEPIKHIVECKTTTEKRIKDLPLQSHVAQVTMYLHFYGNERGATAEVAYLIKETGEIRSFPITYDRQYARQLIVGLMEVQAAITMLREPLPIPEDYQATSYPCAWYTPQGLRRCGFWDHCWGSQVATVVEKKDVVAVIPPLAQDVQEYAKLRAQQQLLESQIDLIKVRRDALEAGFSDVLDDRQANVLRAGDVTVSRSVVEGRTTTDIKAAIADGVIAEDVIKPYQKTSHPYARWTVRKPKKKNQPSKGDI